MVVSIGLAQNKVSYQGRLLENQEPVNLTKTMTFAMGAWEETQDVVIEDGLYAVILGEIVPIPDEIFDDDNLSLQVSIDSQLIETAILPVPVAVRAKRSDDTDKIAGTPVEGTPQADQVLKYDGTSWVPGTDETGNQEETDPVWSNASSNYYTKDELSSVANTGSYNDLKDQPTIAYSTSIPADQLTQGEVSNIKSKKLADGTVPWNTNTIDSSRVSGLSTVAKTGSYNDLTGKPSSIAADDFTQTEVNNIRSNKLSNGTTPWNSNSISSSRISGLHSVATSGNYNDLSNRPSGGFEVDSGIDAIGTGQDYKYMYHDLGRTPKVVEITMSFNGGRSCSSKWVATDSSSGNMIALYVDYSGEVNTYLKPNTKTVCRDHSGSSSYQDFDIYVYSNKIKIKRGSERSYTRPNITEIGWVVY